MDPTSTNGPDDASHADVYTPSSHTQASSQRRGSQSSSTLEARRIRKRELDRHAQRCARQRTKDRIAFLEACLEEAYQAGPSPVRIVALLEELAAVKKQRDELIDVVSSIQRTLQNGLPLGIETKHTRSPVDVSLAPARVPENGPVTSTISPHSGPPDPISLPEMAASVGNSFADHGRTALSNSALHERVPGTEPFPVEGCQPYGVSTMDYKVNEVEPIVPPPEEPCHCMIPNRPVATISSEPHNIWRSVNKVLSQHESALRSTSTTDTAYDGDIPVRVVVEGWDAVEQTGLLTTAWKKLRAVDELCFTACDQVARLAIIHTMYLFLRWDTNPSPQNLQELPKWYLRRPSQDLAHSRAIDYFVWPGVREKFVFSQHRYCSNRFWQIFSRNLRILWTQGLHNCYSLDFVTGRYYITPEFKSQIRDLRCWTMVGDFFADFPDLSCDIPSYEEVPRTLPLVDTESTFLADSELDERQETAHLDTMLAMDRSYISTIGMGSKEFWQAEEIPGCTLQDFLCGN